MSIDTPKNPKISHILAIDYGKSKVGLALADTETRIAFAYNTIKNDKNLLQNLAEIVEEKNVKMIVLGKSMAQKDFDIDEIAQKITGELKVKIEYQEEMFTTKIAQKNLIEKGVKDIKKYDDQEAARIILQNWLDKA